MENKLGLLVAFVVIFLAVGIGIFLFKTIEVKNELSEFVYLNLQSNAEVSFKVDDKENIVEVIPINEEAKIMLSDVNVKDMTLDQGVTLVLKELNDMGYLSSKEILIFTLNEKGKEETIVKDKVKKFIEENKEVKEIKVKTSFSNETKAEADNLKISSEKLLLIKKVIELDSTKTIELLKDNTITEIYAQIKEYKEEIEPNYQEEKTRIIEENKTQLETKPEVFTKYKVLFILDNGSKDLEFYVESGKPVEKVNNPVKSGYKFLGWYVFDTKFDLTTVILKDTTIKAKWEKIVVNQPSTQPNTTTEPINNTTNTDDCFTYVEGVSGLTITSYKDTCSKTVTIPSTINNKTVTTIGENAFKSKLITSVSIPNTVTNIGKYAFADNSINTIVIPSSVTRIEWGAFYNSKIYTLTLNEGMKYIDTNAFSNNFITSLNLPTSLEGMGNYAFSYNKLTNLIIPSNIKIMGWGVFINNEISNLEIRSGAVIGTNAFNNNKLPNNQAFIYKRNTDGSIDNTTIVSYGGLSKESVVIPSEVKTIGREAFDSVGLNGVYLPIGLENINSNAFSKNNLIYVVIPNTVKNIYSGAFYSNKLTNIIIPTSVVNMGSYAFNNNKLPDDKAFIYKRNIDGTEDKTKLVSYGGLNRTNIIIPSTITTLESHSFAYNEISNITIPSTVTSIAKGAFYGNYSKMNITVNNNSNNVNITAGAFPTDANINYQP